MKPLRQVSEAHRKGERDVTELGEAKPFPDAEGWWYVRRDYGWYGFRLLKDRDGDLFVDRDHQQPVTNFLTQGNEWYGPLQVKGA